MTPYRANSPSCTPLNRTTTLFGSTTEDSIQIFLRRITGECITIVVQRSDLVEKIKEILEKKEGIMNDKRLVFQGHTLENGRSLSDYNINECDTIHLLIRIRGGAGFNFGKPFFSLTQTVFSVPQSVSSSQSLFSLPQSVSSSQPPFSLSQFVSSSQPPFSLPQFASSSQPPFSLPQPVSSSQRVSFVPEAKPHDGLLSEHRQLVGIMYAMTYGELAPGTRPPPGRTEVLEMSNHVWATYALRDPHLCARLLVHANDMTIRLIDAQRVDAENARAASIGILPPQKPVKVYVLPNGGSHFCLNSCDLPAIIFLCTLLKLACTLHPF